jgi:hypothetical protein
MTKGKSFFGVRGNKGSHHILLSLLMLFLSIVGAWNLYNWYKAGTVQENISQMLNDFKDDADSVITNSQDRQAVDKKIGEIRQIIGKYTGQGQGQ